MNASFIDRYFTDGKTISAACCQDVFAMKAAKMKNVKLKMSCHLLFLL